MGAERVSGLNGEELSVTFSAGVAEFPRDGGDLEALYHAADRALALPWRACPGTAGPQLDVGSRRLAGVHGNSRRPAARTCRRRKLASP